MEKRKKCYTYLRVSTEKQVDGYSIDAQRKNVQKLADLKDFEIVREYVDAGFSGADIQNRPAFTQMMQDIQTDKDGIQYVLSFKLSRMGRNAIDTLESLRKMQRHGVNILTDDGAVDSSSAYGNFFILIMSGLAEMERENILAQTFAGRVEKARQGRYNGGQAPYGYRIRHSSNRKEDGVLEINEEEAPLIRLIFDRYVNHERGDGKVADYLLSHGYSKAVRENGKLQYIDESFVSHVIKNQIYCGLMVYGKRKNVKNPETGKISTKMRDKADWYLSEGLHEAIISKEMFDKAQKIRVANTHNQLKVWDEYHASIFSGILVCPYCGAPMHGMGGHGKRRADGSAGKPQYYYSCSNHRRKRGEYRCPNSRGVRQDRIDSLMAEIIVHNVKDEHFRSDINSRIDKAVDTTEYESQLKHIESQIRNKVKTLKKKSLVIDNFDWDAENADSIYDALNEDYMKLHNEIAALEKARSKTEEVLKGVEEQKITTDNVYKFILYFGKIYKQLSEVQKKELVNKFIERVEILPEEKEDGTLIKSVTFRFPFSGFGNDGKTANFNSLTTGTHLETCALLVREIDRDVDMVSIKVDMDGINFKQQKQIEEEKPTYENIMKWVLDKYGFKVSSLYIAQIKEKAGIQERKNYNIGSGKGIVPICPKEKEDAIMDAFRHFNLVR